MSKINLPSVLTEKTHFYKEHEKELKKYLGWKYVSYSTLTSVDEYEEDFIKNKFLGIKSEGSIYTTAGTIIGSILELGKLPKNIPSEIKIADDFNIKQIRNPKAEFEKLTILELADDIILIGFCDMVETNEDGSLTITDLKTGAENKKPYYSSEKYYQLVIYAYSLIKMGYDVRNIKVEFVLRTGSHVKPPLLLNNDFTRIDLEYNEERVIYALDKVHKSIGKINSLYTTYQKLFK